MAFGPRHVRITSATVYHGFALVLYTSNSMSSETNLGGSDIGDLRFSSRLTFWGRICIVRSVHDVFFDLLDGFSLMTNTGV